MLTTYVNSLAHHLPCRNRVVSPFMPSYPYVRPPARCLLTPCFRTACEKIIHFLMSMKFKACPLPDFQKKREGTFTENKDYNKPGRHITTEVIDGGSLERNNRTSEKQSNTKTFLTIFKCHAPFCM